MRSHRPEVGARIRTGRQERHLSLNDVAVLAGISAATLSRVETSKQSVDVDLLMTLATILGVQPGRLLGSEDDAPDIATAADRIAGLPAADRVQVMRAASHRRRQKDLGAVVDDLLSTLDSVRDELEQMAQAARKRRKR